MKTIKVSIIATFYNLEDYVERCVDSLSSQTLQDIEIICVNDGSKDNTIRILQELAKNDNRIKIIDKKNEGVSIARNTGINSASGEYIMFVDGDDFLEIDACEKLYNKAIKSDVDIVIFQKKYVYQLKKTKLCKYFKKSLYYRTIKNEPFFLFDKIPETYNAVHSLYCWDKFYKKNLLHKYNLYFPKDINLAEDNIFIYNTFLKNPKIVIIDEYLYNYYVSRINSLTKLNNYDFFNKLVCIIDKYITYNNQVNTKLYLYTIDYYFNILTNLWNYFYFSEYKKEYLICLYKYFDKYKIFNINEINKLSGYKKAKRLFFLDKYHLYTPYWCVLRPICKYCIVRPYRFIKNCFKS